ncbi:hypothetical protein Poly30_06270 [Planctomycetes bacterium Poly30]|uniref:Right handed beta helix domain-containing protein n=1 Tax=Saltatorellus ferox TaxID=2528018 RepID=A0A518EM17_9BACT|nr:hypothetical protein Poly30_06270 [Planctomycetes bacterium Poly30]
MIRPLIALALLLHLAAAGFAFQKPTASGDFAKPMDPAEPESPYPPGDLDRETPGFFLRGHADDRFRFVPWASERTLTEALARLPKVAPEDRDGPRAEVRMAPGRYIIEQQIVIDSVHRLTVTGDESARFVFADGPNTTTFLGAPANVGDLVLRVDHPERIREGFNYQVYAASNRGDRMLEFSVLAVKDELVYLTRPVQYMPHVREIPAGSQVVEEVNFFRARKCRDLILQGLHCDGRHRGGTRTHTTYCGVYYTGLYVPGKRATTKGLIVRNCSFKNLKGRGVVFYGAEDVLIEGNYFEHIRAQAIEIDHFASGRVRGNVVNGAEVGVMVNDAYESVVEGNVLRYCLDGVRFLEIFDDDWVNSGNIVRDNLIGPGLTSGNSSGVNFFNEGMVDNVVQGNVFVGLKDARRVVRGEGNVIRLDGE